MTADSEVLRRELLALLQGGNAHMGLDAAVADFPLAHMNKRAPNCSRPPGQTGFTPWHLLEHMRIAQWDIVGFVRNPRHVSPLFPEGYWPDPDDSADGDRWEQTLAGFRSDLRELKEMVIDSSTDLLAPLSHAKGYTLFREVLVVADHNAYHIGQFALLRDVMKTWT